MASTALIVLTLCALQLGYGIYVNEVKEYHGLCLDVLINKMVALHKLDNCTVILGDLKLRLERTKPREYVNVRFPNLREVTGCLAVYGASGLESVGGLFPNLMRVRGNTLINDYALIISNMPSLKEIGLANLLKVDRGGIIIWPGPLTCYVDSVNWSAIAPNARHVLSGIETFHNPCKSLPCSCTTNSSTNFCWNNKKCQRFLEGPEAEKCSPECVGCLKRNGSICSLCRYYVYQNQCVNTCPNGTIPLTDTNYCVTIDECTHLERWPWNNTCVSDCPQNYVKYKNETTCVLCENCDLTCNNVTIQTLKSIQEAARCVYIKGHLSIHIRSPPETMNELRYYLKSIQEVTDYIEIRGSLVITSLDFLPALKRIKGKKLYNNKYSLLIHDMHSLQSLFPQNVTLNLKVDRGSVAFYRNQMLCMSEIEKLVPFFPVRPTDLDIPQGLNGYSGSCFNVFFNFTIQVKNETNAVAILYSESNKSIEYTILYVKVSDEFRSMLIPEVCSEFDWHAISIQKPVDKFVEVELASLNPATKYAICIEEFDLENGRIARSSVKNFSTSVGKPEPPFIVELTANSSEEVFIRWVDHLDYLPYITRYELDVTLIDNMDKITKNHCSEYDEFDWQEDFSVHARVMTPPKKYDKSCESICGLVSKATVGAMVDEYFDVCNAIKDCDQKPERPLNETVGNYVKNLALNINGKRNEFQVGGLAPYRDYRFQLRACTDRNCSVSSRNVVKTLRAINADIPTVTFFTASEKGDVSVKWEPPQTINGAVLSYTVEVTPVIKFNNYSLLLPHTVCVSRNITSLIIKMQIASKYVLRLCMKTLASSYSCGERMKVLVSSEVYSNIGYKNIFLALFGIILSVTLCVVGWRWKKRDVSDDIPLVDVTSMYRNESEPPAVMMSDFAPIYTIPWRDTHL